MAACADDLGATVAAASARAGRDALCGKAHEYRCLGTLPAHAFFGQEPERRTVPLPHRPLQAVTCGTLDAFAARLPTVPLAPAPLSSKLTRLVQLLTAISPAKAVIFASFNEGLEHTMRALAAHGVGAVRVKGKSAVTSLNKFLSDASCRACLLHTGQDGTLDRLKVRTRRSAALPGHAALPLCSVCRSCPAAPASCRCC